MVGLGSHLDVRLPLGLSALGLQKGEIACILSETRAEFYLVDLGIMGAGGVSAALYTAYPMPELAANIEASGRRFLFVEDRKHSRIAGEGDPRTRQLPT